MMANDTAFAKMPSQIGMSMLYLDFVATAPWNRPTFQTPPKYKGTGTIFVTAAIHLSLELGFKGRIGLHSLPNAERFYENKVGMTRLGPDASHEDLNYYEMSRDAAKAFLEKRR